MDDESQLALQGETLAVEGRVGSWFPEGKNGVHPGADQSKDPTSPLPQTWIA